MIKLVKVEKEETNFLSGEFAKEHDIDEILLLDEFTPQDAEFDNKTITRLTGNVACNDKGKSQKAWSMSKTNKNIMIELFGDDTKNWIEKKLSINVPSVSTPGGMKPSIQIDERRTKKIN